MLSSTGRKTIDMIMVNYDSIYFLANQQFEGFNHDSKLGTEIFALEQCLLFRDPGVYSFFGARGFFAKTVINTANIHEFLDTPHLKQDSSTQQLF